MRIIRRKWGKRWGRERMNGKKRKILGRWKSKIHSTLKNYITSLYPIICCDCWWWEEREGNC
jgi:hypothetical protein